MKNWPALKWQANIAVKWQANTAYTVYAMNKKVFY